jgi:hypothetical protein
MWEKYAQRLADYLQAQRVHGTNHGMLFGPQMGEAL